jgi:two-component system nitrate/nitrite response regulator NarL
LRACGADYEPILIFSVSQLHALVASAAPPRLAIIDVTQSLSLDLIREFHLDFPNLPLIALGLREQEADIVAHGSAGFIGYLRREDGLGELRARVDDALCGRMLCSPEIAAGIMRGLFQRETGRTFPATGLTAREAHVEGLIRRGLSNKEIARSLDLSESTVKHHVHAILGKRRLNSRFQLMRDGREPFADWEMPRQARTGG